MEIVSGVILSIKGIIDGNFKMAKMGVFLIRQGFKSIILSFEKAYKNEEIDLAKYFKEKGKDYLTAAISIIVGDSACTIASSATELITKEIVKTVTSYAIKKTAEYSYKILLQKSVAKLQSYGGKYIG